VATPAREGLHSPMVSAADAGAQSPQAEEIVAVVKRLQGTEADHSVTGELPGRRGFPADQLVVGRRLTGTRARGPPVVDVPSDGGRRVPATRRRVSVPEDDA
jgi:hypothetical protein